MVRLHVVPAALAHPASRRSPSADAAADCGSTVSPQPASATGSLPASTACSTAQPAIM
jgi:hypothetical protein